MRKLTREEMMAVSGGEGCYWDNYGNLLYCDPPPPPPPPRTCFYNPLLGCSWLCLLCGGVLVPPTSTGPLKRRLHTSDACRLRPI